MQIKDIIKDKVNKMSIYAFQYFYNDVNIEILNDSDRNIYTFATFNRYVRDNMFSDMVMDSLLENIANGNVDCYDTYVYFDVYLHLQSIDFIDMKQNFISEIFDENMFDDDMLIEIKDMAIDIEKQNI